jgi:hypothetical protein
MYWENIIQHKEKTMKLITGPVIGVASSAKVRILIEMDIVTDLVLEIRPKGNKNNITKSVVLRTKEYVPVVGEISFQDPTNTFSYIRKQKRK